VFTGVELILDLVFSHPIDLGNLRLVVGGRQFDVAAVSQQNGFSRGKNAVLHHGFMKENRYTEAKFGRTTQTLCRV
jgi:hypothetical protein